MRACVVVVVVCLFFFFFLGGGDGGGERLLTLSTNSVTNVVRTAYFQIQTRSSPLKKL